MPKNIAIIGSGVIGLCSAYYLAKAGHRITLFDKGPITDGCSFGNAGMIVPSHFIPLSAPGMITKAIRWMFDASSPFYVKPRLDLDLARWAYYFCRHATKAHQSRSMPALRDLSLFSKSCFLELENELPFDFGFEQRGLLMLYQSKAAEQEETKTVRLAHQQGLEAHLLSRQEIQGLEPNVLVNVRGGVFFPGDAHITPHALITQLMGFLRETGVSIRPGDEVQDFVLEGGVVKELVTTHGGFVPDDVVLAAGAWSGSLARRLGIELPMEAGKGYSVTVPQAGIEVRIPSILVEARVAVTPMTTGLRVAGTMEFGGINHEVDMRRVKRMVDAMSTYYPGVELPEIRPGDVWHGLRPCSPDGLPFIGRANHINNLIVATGHSMMGVSLGPGTGKLVAELVDGKAPSLDLRLCDPERYD